MDEKSDSVNLLKALKEFLVWTGYEEELLTVQQRRENLLVLVDDKSANLKEVLYDIKQYRDHNQVEHKMFTNENIHVNYTREVKKKIMLRWRREITTAINTDGQIVAYNKIFSIRKTRSGEFCLYNSEIQLSLKYIEDVAIMLHTIINEQIEHFTVHDKDSREITRSETGHHAAVL